MGLFRNRRGDGSGMPGELGATPPKAARTDSAVLPHAYPRQLTSDRIVSWLRENEFHFFADDDDDIGGLWRGRLFYFFLFGEQKEILQVRGLWLRDIALERLDEVFAACGEWNSDRIWPKTYVRVRDNGMINVIAETSTDLEYGATDDQLSQLLHCGLSTANSFFDEIDKLYPDPAAMAP